MKTPVTPEQQQDRYNEDDEFAREIDFNDKYQFDNI